MGYEPGPNTSTDSRCKLLSGGTARCTWNMTPMWSTIGLRLLVSSTGYAFSGLTDLKVLSCDVWLLTYVDQRLLMIVLLLRLALIETFTLGRY